MTDNKAAIERKISTVMFNGGQSDVLKEKAKDWLYDNAMRIIAALQRPEPTSGFDKFVEMLDREPQYKPRLAKLLADQRPEPSEGDNQEAISQLNRWARHGRIAQEEADKIIAALAPRQVAAIDFRQMLNSVGVVDELVNVYPPDDEEGEPEKRLLSVMLEEAFEKRNLLGTAPTQDTKGE